jgi:hypothetical protein
MSTPEEVRAFLTAYVENWNGEGDRLADIFHAGGSLQNPGEKPWSVAETAQLIATVKAGVPDLHIRILEWAHRDDQLFTEWEMAGTRRPAPDLARHQPQPSAGRSLARCRVLLGSDGSPREGRAAPTPARCADRAGSAATA